MSVIFGIVKLNGEPLQKETLDTMQKALEFCGPDVKGIWKDDFAAMGSYIRSNTPESHLENQPIYLEDNRKIMVATARIDNRDDLCAAFNIPLAKRDSYPDSHYIHLAYEKWGEECPDHLLGDWSFAVWDKEKKDLFVARDHCGIMALYYYSCPDFFAFSSSPKGLLALSEIPKTINEFRIAQILVAWPGDGEQTCYQHIFNLLPGAYLTLKNKTLKKTAYWELKEQEELILPKEQDYYDRFLEIFSEAVRCRLRTTKNVGISLSGGLDSTSIAAIAAIELAKQNKELYAFTSVPLYKDYKIPKHRNGDEGELAGLMAKMYPNIRHYLVNAEGYSPIEAIKKAVEIFDEPMHAAANQYWIQAISDKANEMEVGTLLNGQGGNGVISWPTSKVKLYNQKGLNYYKHRLKIAYDSMHDLLFDRERFKYPFLKYSDINPEFAESLDLRNKMKLSGHDPKFNRPTPFKNAQCRLILQAFMSTYSFHFKKSLWDGINVYDPTGDIRLIQYSLKLPKTLYKKHNFERILVKQGLKNYLPSDILASTHKGIQASDIQVRILNYKDCKVLDDFHLNNSPWINYFNEDVCNTNFKNTYWALTRNISSLSFLSKILKNLINEP